MAGEPIRENLMFDTAQITTSEAAAVAAAAQALADTANTVQTQIANNDATIAALASLRDATIQAIQSITTTNDALKALQFPVAPSANT